MGVGAALFPPWQEEKVMRCFVHHDTRVFPAAVDNLPQTIPRVLLHQEGGRAALHLLLCTACQELHRHQCLARRATQTAGREGNTQVTKGVINTWVTKEEGA
ncbi:hypothetical protein FKM82_027566 [Ascaphus truei]